MKLNINKPKGANAVRPFLALLVFLIQFGWMAEATAQLPPAGTPWQFDITGFLQEATPTNPIDPQAGGTLKVNGHLVTVPASTIVILPANALTWQELFSQAPAPYTGVATGMAAADVPEPLAKHEVHVLGNVMPGATPGTGQYIAGLVTISQQGLNSGQGYINFIDYAAGEIRVGGVMGDPAGGTRVRINDPIGKFGRAVTPDRRFTIDEDNPTIRSETGFPMCLPRVTADPNVPGNPDDPLCPQGNRPRDATGAFAGNFTMNDPTPGTGLPGVLPDATKQAPFEIGDFVTFAGTLVSDNAAAPTAGPYPGTASTYISAHTITNNIAIYTWPNTNPAYVAIDVTLLGTGGTTVIGATEAAARTRFEGFSTDPSRIVHLYGIDLNCDGSVAANRDWGTIDVDPGPPLGAAKGRWRFRPPSKVLSLPATGVFLPATREVRAVIEPTRGSAQLAGWTTGNDVLYANGIIAGQYHAPIGEYIFPEQVVGNPVPPANFESMPFLANGGYSSSAGTVAGQLSPWPGSPTPPSSCQAPAATASAVPTTVGSGGTVTLSATATGTAPITFTWTQIGGTSGSFSSTSGASVTWTAPNVAALQTATFQVSATNSNGFSTATVNVTVNPTPLVITSATASNTQIASNGTVGLSATATGPAPITFAWTQTAGPTGTFTPAPPNAASVNWTAPLVSVATNATFSVTATNGTGSVTSGPVTVTINPVGTPTVQPVTAQSVVTGAAVSIPVTVTTANSNAKLG
ncbi:MAG TPA: hypothetical protein VF104_06885, partial [Burkholderiales bacterium]